MPQYLHTDRLDQGRPSPWEEHTHQLKKMILQLELFHELSEGSLTKGRRGQTVNSVLQYLTWRLVDITFRSLCADHFYVSRTFILFVHCVVVFIDFQKTFFDILLAF